MLTDETNTIFDPGSAHELHVVIFTNVYRQEIHVFNNEEHAVISMREILKDHSQYDVAFDLQRLVIFPGLCSKTYQREYYKTIPNISRLELTNCSAEVECPLKFD